MKKLEKLKQALVKEFKGDPRNKFFVPHEMLVLSVIEHTGNKKFTSAQLNKIIKDWGNGKLNDKGLDTYDAACSVIYDLAGSCFGDGPDDDVRFETTFLTDDSGFFAEVRPY